MNGLNIGISTQTPLLRFQAPAASVTLPRSGGAVVELERPVRGRHTVNPGGVCRMVLPTLREWHKGSFLKEAQWLSLQPGAPAVESYDGLPIDIRHLSLPSQELAAYARTKEKLWADIHGLPAPDWSVDDFRFYARYNWFNADALLESSRDLDVAYVHDFQLLQVGGLIGLAAPSVLRWHVPFNPTRIPAYTRHFLVRTMEDFDGVIVSTRRDLEGLVKAGFHGHARQVYPHIDLADWPDAAANQVQEVEARWRLRPEHELILCVARMDPMKRQDLAIQALAKLRHKHPHARLVLVGNGTFSAAKTGGLGLTKAHEWRHQLEVLAKDLGIAPEVVFAGHLPDALLPAAYTRAAVAVLPSDIEGFGLTTLEGWRYGKASIVSKGAGSAEIITEGLNGLTFAAGDADALASKLDEILSSAEQRHRMGEAGRASLRTYSVQEGATKEREILTEALERFDAT